MIKESLNIRPSIKEKLNILLDIVNEQQLSIVNSDIIKTAGIISDNKDYLFGLFATWMDSVPSSRDVVDFITTISDMPKDIANLLEIAWKTLPKKERAKFILQITDQISWRKFSLNRVEELIKDKELKQTLIKENSFTSKLVRKATSALISIISNPKK